MNQAKDIGRIPKETALAFVGVPVNAKKFVDKRNEIYQSNLPDWTKEHH